MCKNPPKQKTINDLLMEKLTEKQTDVRSQMNGKAFKFSLVY